jgi:hypothetical protein
MKARGPGMSAADPQVPVVRSKTLVALLKTPVFGSKPPNT